MTNRTYLPALVFSLLCLIWGSTWLFIKIGLQDAPPFLSAGLRFTVASLLLYPFMRLRGLQLPRDTKTLSIMIYTGLFAISVSYGLVYWSEQYISAGLTSVLFSTHPFFVILFSHFMLADDRLSLTKVLGSAIGFSGVAVIFMDTLRIDNPKAPWATLAVIVSAVCAAVSNVVVKRHSASLNPVVLTVVQILCGAITLLTIGLLFENTADFKVTLRSVGSVFYLAVVGSSIAFICFYWLVRQIRVTVASLLVFVIPIVALFLDWLVFGKTLDWRAFVGSGLVLCGIAIAHR